MADKKKHTVLIVEDELPFRQIYRDALNMNGYEVMEAEDGDEALQMVTATPPDLVLLDIILPKRSGFEVLTVMKQTPASKDIPVVVYSVLNDQASIDKAISMGAAGFTIKGATPAFEVMNEIRHLLGDDEPVPAQE